MKLYYVPVDKQQETIGEVKQNPIVAVFDEATNISVNFELVDEKIHPAVMVQFINDGVKKLNEAICQEEKQQNESK